MGPSLISASKVETENSEDPDRFTEGVRITLPGKEDAIVIQSFTTARDTPQRDRENPDMEHIQLYTSDCDGRGGIQTLDEDTAVLAARLACHLRRLDWSVVPTYDGFF